MASGIRNIGLVAMAAMTLGACDDPPPSLETPERVEALERCDTKLAALAANDTQLKALCDCTTARLSQQRLSLSDLDSENRDRAMEQVRWCMSQTGAAPVSTPGGINAEDSAPDGGEGEEGSDEGEGAAN